MNITLKMIFVTQKTFKGLLGISELKILMWICYMLQVHNKYIWIKHHTKYASNEILNLL